MQTKQLLKLLLAAIFAATTLPLTAQVAPAAKEASTPLEVGAGMSSYDVDWGHGRMLGGTFRADYYPSFLPAIFHGLGIEAEARDISMGHSSTQPSNFREDTAGGGVIYKWRRYAGFQPYGKALMSLGSLDFKLGHNSQYSHDTRTVTSFGAGFQIPVYRKLSVRADYEYQFWPHLFQHLQTLTPQGFTLGAMYSFGGPGR